MRIFTLFMFILTLTACNLANAPASEEPIQITIASTSTAISTSTITPIASPQATSTAIPSTATNQPSTCEIPSTWIRYTVQSGDTLFQIAQLAQSSVQELVDGNCLASADNITVGQVIYLPNAIARLSPAVSPIIYWLVSDNAVNDDSVAVGCGTYLTAISGSSSVTNDASVNVRLALQELFNRTPAVSSPYRNYWDDYNASIDTIVVDEGGTATIRLNGDFLLVGTCGDAEIIAQILLTVFEEPEIQTAWITIDGMNLKQISDMSGQTGPNAVFTRDDIPIVE